MIFRDYRPLNRGSVGRPLISVQPQQVAHNPASPAQTEPIAVGSEIEGGENPMADGDRSVCFRHKAWAYTARCAHSRLIAEPCAECQRCAHGVSAIGGDTCLYCERDRPLSDVLVPVIVIGDDEPSLSEWIEWAALGLDIDDIRDAELFEALMEASEPRGSQRDAEVEREMRSFRGGTHVD